MNSSRILIVDDEPPIREVLSASLRDEGHEVFLASDGESGLQMMSRTLPEIVFLDIWMPGAMDGLEVLKKARALGVQSEFVMISGHGTIETAVKATKLGAWDFIEKPLSINKVLINIANIQAYLREKREKLQLLSRLRRSLAIVGDSSVMKDLKKRLSELALGEEPVLILGEKGSGRDLVAQNLHYASPRAGQEWVPLQLQHVPVDLMETEIFGDSESRGKFDLASEGTLFVSDLHLLPAVLQERLAEKLRRNSPRPRFVGATPLALESLSPGLQAVLESRLLVIPPLRNRKEDLPALIEAFSHAAARELGVLEKKISPAALQLLMQHSWPGHVRELRNFVERLYILASEDVIEAQDVYFAGLQDLERRSGEGGMSSFREARALFERKFLVDSLSEFGGNISKTAEKIGLERSYLHRKLKLYGIEVSRSHDESGS